MYVLTEQKEAARAALMQARAQQRPVIKVGIDAHLSQMMVVVQHDETGAKAPVKCEAGRVEVMARNWIQNGAVVFACYEAGPLGFGLQRRLAAAGVYCLVVRPRTLNEYGSRVKTDRRDAAWLCANLDRYLYGNDQAIAPVSIPTEAEERWRAGGRERRHLSRQRRREIQRYRGTCLSQGFNLEGDWWRPRRWAEYQEVLPIELREQGERMLGRLEQIDRDLKQIDEQLAAQLPATPPHGVGALTSALVDREIIQWSRFRCRQQVASYFGLVPSEHSSGNEVVRGSITKQGNGALRHLLVEASWRLVRFQPGYCRVKKWNPVFTDPKAGCSRRKKAIVALARQFAVDLWRIHTGRVSPQALGLTIQDGRLALRDSAGNRAN